MDVAGWVSSVVRAWAGRCTTKAACAVLLAAASCGYAPNDASETSDFDDDAPAGERVASAVTARSFGGLSRLPVTGTALRSEGPAAVAFAGGVYTVVRDVHNHLHTYLLSRLTGWLDLGVDASGFVAASKPALTVALDQVLTAVRGDDAAIHIQVGSAAALDASLRERNAPLDARAVPRWFTLPGTGFTSAPALASDGSLLYAFAARSDGVLYVSRNDLGATQPRAYVHTRWSPWTALPGVQVTSDPAAAAWSGGIAVVVRGADRRLVSARADTWFEHGSRVRFDAPLARAWRALGDAPVGSAPALATWSAGLVVFARGMDGACWLASLSSTGPWSSWVALPTGLLSAAVGAAPGAAFDDQTRDLFVFGAGLDRAVHFARAHRARS